MVDANAILDEAILFGFAVERKWIEALGIKVGFFSALRKDLLLYELALKQVTTILENFNLFWLLDGNKHAVFLKPVEHRLKEINSLLAKIKNLVEEDGCSPDAYRSHPSLAHDIAGARVIVNYLDMIDDVVDYITGSDNILIKTISDHVEEGRGSGYRGVHLLAEVPLKQGDFNPLVEIQIRTGHEHSWAIQSHALTYKRGDIGKKFQTELNEISDMLYGVDQKWVEIRKKVDVAMIKNYVGINED